MITIVSGTNKKNSLTRQVAAQYETRIRNAGAACQLLALDEISFDFISPQMFAHRPAGVVDLQQRYFNTAKTFVFVVPEYNGSFPGILKLLIDAFEVKSAFENKCAALVGVATGRAGNLRGLDHLSSILHHMHVTVVTGNVLISRARDEMDASGNLIHEATAQLIDRHVARIVSV